MSRGTVGLGRSVLVVMALCALLLVDFFTIYGTYYDYYVTSMPFPPEQHRMLVYMLVSLVVTLMYIFLVFRKYQFVLRDEIKVRSEHE